MITLVSQALPEVINTTLEYTLPLNKHHTNVENEVYTAASLQGSTVVYFYGRYNLPKIDTLQLLL